MKISNYQEVKNQFLLEGENFTILQSYNSIVALKYGGELYLGPNHDYSRTTSKYVKLFTGKTTEERRKGLASGEIKKIDENVLKKLNLGGLK